MPKIIDLEVLDNFKTRQDEQNDGHFLKRSDVTKDGNDVKVVIDESDSSKDLKVLTPESIFGDVVNRIISLEHIPAAAREYVVTVNSEAAKLALTKNDIQNGDVVHVVDTTNNVDKMYYVVDDTKLGTNNAFQVFKAGIASEVAWGNVTGKPTSKGSATQPVYIDNNGTPVKCTYSLSKSVPSDAKFTDTTYSVDGTALTKDSNNKISHSTSAGYKHIPSGGSSGQILRWSANGTAVWGSDNNTTYSAAANNAISLSGTTFSHSTAAGYKHIPSGGSDGKALVYAGTSGSVTWGSPEFAQYSGQANSLATEEAGKNGIPVYFTVGVPRSLTKIGGEKVSSDASTTIPIVIPVGQPSTLQAGMIWIEE